MDKRDQITSIFKKSEIQKNTNVSNDFFEHCLIHGFDYIIEQRKDKIVYSDYRDTKGDPELDVYLNSQYWRISILIDAVLDSYQQNNILASLINLRHLYETIVHSFYLLKHLEIHLVKQDGKKFYELLWTFTYATTGLDLFGETKKQHKKSLDIVEKLPHIHDSLKFYLKEADNIKTDTNIHPTDVLYRQVSEIAHPNSMGSVRFFSKVYPNKVLFQKKQIHVEVTFYAFFISLIVELHLHCNYIRKFNNLINEKFLSMCQKYSLEDGGFFNTKRKWYEERYGPRSTWY